MTETVPVTFTEEHVPFEGIEESIDELVELYGGEVVNGPGEGEPQQRRFTLPLRRGVAAGGGVECTLSWAAQEGEGDRATLTLICDRDVDAPKAQRILMLVAGVVGAVLFMIWPFFPAKRELGALAWIGGAIAIAVYLLTLRKTSGGVAYDFLRRLADRQRSTIPPTGGN